MYKEEYAFSFFKASQDEMQKKTQGLSKRIVELIAEADFSELGNLQQECKHMRYSAQGYLEESKIPDAIRDTLVNVGYTTALLDMIQMYLQKLTIQNEMQQIKTKYRNAVLSILAKNGTMLHKDLACAIGVSASGLTAVIKQMNATAVQTVQVKEVSKFKLYTITPAAYKYALYNIPNLTLDVAAEGLKENVYFNYAMEMRKRMQFKEKEMMIKGHAEGIRDVRIQDKGNKKYSAKQTDFGKLVEYGRKLA